MYFVEGGGAQGETCVGGTQGKQQCVGLSLDDVLCAVLCCVFCVLPAGCDSVQAADAHNGSTDCAGTDVCMW